MGREEGSKKMKIAIIHPDLGIGNVLHQAFNEYPLNKRISERLIVDAVVELASHGHKVHVFTSHHDQSRCFEATLSGVFQVTVYGSFLSRHIFYRCLFVCSLCSLGMVYLRCCTSRPGFSRCPIAETQNIKSIQSLL
ncbi:unnamed protein product [Brassica rapa]|uniref:Glycosyltransferase subfamily 4-like N-terminal domain-containing protein n=1 Tax=Brassica campestris TaxID=3711 RepID=A0A8D9H6B1_BRACM|nr:unnamed protein product [Brassica rapa]